MAARRQFCDFQLCDYPFYIAALRLSQHAQQVSRRRQFKPAPVRRGGLFCARRVIAVAPT